MSSMAKKSILTTRWLPVCLQLLASALGVGHHGLVCFCQWRQCCFQESAFAAAFLVGIPGGQFNEQQDRWVLPVGCQQLYYTPRLLAATLLLALTHCPPKRTNSPAADGIDGGDTLDTPQLIHGHEPTSAAAGCPQQLRVPTCCVRDGATALDCLREAGRREGGAPAHASEALCEGLEKVWGPPEPSSLSPPPEEQARVITAHSTFSTANMMHATPSTVLTDRVETLPGGCEDEITSIVVCSTDPTHHSWLGSHHGSLQASTSRTAIPVWNEGPSIFQTVCVPGRKAGNVWLGLRHDLMLELQRLRTSRQEPVPNSVILLSSMLCKYSRDVLWSGRMRSAAAAAVALSTSAAQAQSSELSPCEDLHSHPMTSCRSSLEGPKSACMSSLHARGIMHAVAQITAKSSMAQGPSQLCSLLANTGEGGTAAIQGARVQAQGISDIGCSQDVVVQGTAAIDVGPATPETLLQNQIQYGLTWKKVCMQWS
jgi:hypothetical protein